MPALIIILVIFVLVFIISRKNYKNRTSNLSQSFISFNELLKENYNKLNDENKKAFLNSLDKDLFNFFNYMILKTPKKLPQNTWTIQQDMIKQEEIFKKLKSFIKKN